MHFLRTIEHLVRAYALELPLEWFVFFGSFLEEVVSPIPSALIMGTAGSLALVRDEPLWYLFWLVLFGNIGKMLGAWAYYFIGDKLEDVLIHRVTKFFGVKHEDLENIGKRFTGHHWKDGGALFLLRAFPFFPTTPVSIMAGVIKMDKRVFLGATYLGNLLKDSVYIYAGYVGWATLQTLWKRLIPLKFGMDILITLGVIAFLFFLYMHRGKGKALFVHCGKRCIDFFGTRK